MYVFIICSEVVDDPKQTWLADDSNNNVHHDWLLHIILQ